LRRLVVESSALGAGLFAAQLLTALTYWVIALRLDPAELGPLIGTIGIARIVTTMADFGMNSATIRALAREPIRSSSFSRALASKLFLASLLGIAWVLLTWVGSTLGVWSPVVVMLGPFLAFEIVARTLEVPLRANRRMLSVSVLAMANSALGLLIVGGIVVSGRDPSLGLPFGLAVASALTVISSWLVIEPEFRRVTRISPRDLVDAWKDSLHFGLVGLTTQIQRADVALVGALAGPTAAGIFAVPARLVGPLTIIPYAYSAAIFPRVAGAQDRRQAHREVVGSAVFMMIGMSILLASIFIFAHPAIDAILGSRYLRSVDVLRIYLIGLLIASLNQPMALLLQAEGEERFVARIVTPACLTGLLGIAIGAGIGGALGAAFGFVLLHVIAASFLLTRSVRLLRRSMQSPSPLSNHDRSGTAETMVRLG
jgi:O-antigen/teichoic acid export membrane protein